MPKVNASGIRFMQEHMQGLPTAWVWGNYYHPLAPLDISDEWARDYNPIIELIPVLGTWRS